MGAQLFVYCCTEASTTTLKASGDAWSRSPGNTQSRDEPITLCLRSILFAERNTQLGLSDKMRPVFVCMLSNALVVKGLGVHTISISISIHTIVQTSGKTIIHGTCITITT